MALPAAHTAQTNGNERSHASLMAVLLNCVAPGLGRFHASPACCDLAKGAARRMRIGSQIVAGAVLVLALSGTTVASAENNNTSSNSSERGTQLAAPRQVGPWTVTGWNNDGVYCAAERQLRGAAGQGATLAYILVRMREGYRIALGSTEWELKAGTTFPVELIANPVLRSDASALALGPNVVGIDLGSDRQLMQRLATAPQIEIKTAQRTFKLPVDAFDRAVAEVDTCFGAIRHLANPFTAPQTAPKQPPASPPPAANSPPASKQPDSPPPAASSTNVSRDTELAEERTFLTVRTSKGQYRLEALVVRPAKAEGRLPVALITHGQNSKPEENKNVHADVMLPQARDLAMRGWLAVAVMRRGYGGSDGLPGLARGNAHMSCENGDIARGFDMEADDLEAALKVIGARPDADGSRAIAIGQSLGGGAVLALAARNPAGLLGVANVSGGVRRKSGGELCDYEPLVAAMAALGARTRVVTQWLYAQNDSLFPPELVRRMHDAYTKAGGRADLHILPPVLHDGHNLFADFNGRRHWLRGLDRFLRAQLLPNANDARADRVMRAAKFAPNMRALVENYLSVPEPKALAFSSRGASWATRVEGVDEARKVALTNCREKYGPECTVAMENNDLVLPSATNTNTAAGTAQ